MASLETTETTQTQQPTGFGSGSGSSSSSSISINNNNNSVSIAATITASFTAKARSRIVVKPILKKLHVHAHSARHSLDLDRGWDDQPMAAASPDLDELAAGRRYASLDYGARDMADDCRHLSAASLSSFAAAAAAPAGGGVISASASAASAAAAAAKAKAKVKAKTAKSSPHDVSFTLSAADFAPPAAGRPTSYSHARSTSGASVATTTSGRNGSFVHPFQQTPRTSTPPLLSYANSAASLQQREYSSTIAEGDGEEGDDEADELLESLSSYPSARHHSHHPSSSSSSSSKPNLRRPSLTSSQRTTSLSDGIVTAVPRLTQSAVNHSRPDLQQSSSVSSANDSALSGAAAAPLAVPSHKTSSPSLASSSPISPFRTSLDMNGFRIRSRSEIDTATRQEQVREARRKFDAKEREKEEKYAREQVRKRERADAKEAVKFERAQAQMRKGSWGNSSSLSSARNSSSSPEKRGFAGAQTAIASASASASAAADDVQFQMPSRSRSAKQRTNGVWTAFMLWLRTRLIKLGR